MALPAGITTATVTFGPAYSYTGEEGVITGTVVADRNIVWAATGAPVFKIPATLQPSMSGGQTSIVLPHTDQPGFLDTNGNAITGWYYVATWVATFPGGTETQTKRFQVLQGQDVVDIDLIPDGPVTPGVTVPAQYVTSVNGQTGAVMVEGGEGAPAKTHVPLLLFIGESNSGGLARNADLPSSALLPRPAVRIWDNNTNDGFDILDIGGATANNLRGHNLITGVTDPLGGGVEDQTRHGWENILATTAEQGRWAEQVYLVKAGQGGSKLNEWDDSDPYWQTFSTRITGAVASIRAAGYEPDVYVMATIGGNDYLTGTTSPDFKTQLVTWLARVRGKIASLTETANVPVAFALLGFDTAYPARLAEIAAVDPYLFVVRTDDAPLMADGHHWTAAGMILIGGRLIEALLSRVGQGAQYAYNVASPDAGAVGLRAAIDALSARVDAISEGGTDPGNGGGGGTVIAADTFTRADSTSTMGATETGGFTWTPLVGTWGIAGQRAYSVSGGSSDVVRFQTPGITDGIWEARLAVKGVSNLLWRVVDADDWYSLYVGGNGDAAVYKSVGGTLTLLANTTGSGSADGDLFSIRVAGSQFVVSRNGTEVATVNDSTHTSGGWGFAGQGSSFRWDDVALTSLT